MLFFVANYEEFGKNMLNIRFFMALFLCNLITSLKAEEQWKLDSRFAALDIIKMVQNRYPSIAKKAKAISHYSGYYSINPFLLSEYSLNYDKKVSTLAQELSTTIHSRNNNLKLSLRSNDIANIHKMMAHYGLNSRKKAGVVNMIPALDLPFDHKREWFFNGVHTWTGNDDGTPMSSIDLTRNWETIWGDDVSDDWVSAAHDGVISVFSSCYVRITHPSGWATDYYHIDNVLFNTGDQVRAGQIISNYADNLAQAICQGGSATGPQLHFSLLKDGSRYALDDQALSLWKIHSGVRSYDSNPENMWLEKNGVLYYAYQNTLSHQYGDNIIDYRYSGIFSTNEINGHGLNISISELKNDQSGELRKIVFIAFYTYDDEGHANFYAGNIDYERWRTDVTQDIIMLQTNGGDFSNLQAINIDTGLEEAGSISLHFLNCSKVEIDFSLLEPVSREMVSQQLVLQKIVGVPNHVCQAPSLEIN